jgi:cell division septal protein FtsQ
MHYVQGVSITTRPPRILNITIEERKPVAFIYGRGLNIIDEQGYLMPVPDQNIYWDLPLISGIKQSLGKLGEQSTAADTYLALEIVRYLEFENPLLLALVSEINLEKRNHIELYLTRGGATIRVSRDLFYKELYILKNYLATYIDWVQLKKIEYIDLRFKDQLIVKHKV